MLQILDIMANENAIKKSNDLECHIYPIIFALMCKFPVTWLDSWTGKIFECQTVF